MLSRLANSCSAATDVDDKRKKTSREVMSPLLHGMREIDLGEWTQYVYIIYVYNIHTFTLKYIDSKVEILLIHNINLDVFYTVILI